MQLAHIAGACQKSGSAREGQSLQAVSPYRRSALMMHSSRNPAAPSRSNGAFSSRMLPDSIFKLLQLASCPASLTSESRWDDASLVQSRTVRGYRRVPRQVLQHAHDVDGGGVHAGMSCWTKTQSQSYGAGLSLPCSAASVQWKRQAAAPASADHCNMGRQSTASALGEALVFLARRRISASLTVDAPD